jgi:hypothetical protein
MTEYDFTPVLGSNLLEFLIDVFGDEVSDALDGQVGDETDGEFAFDRAGNDGL